MNAYSMNIAGREIVVRFDVKAWLEAEEAFGSLGKMYDLLEGEEQPMKHAITLTAITANAGERHAGRDGQLTAEWFAEHASPKQIRLLNTMAKLAVAAGMKRECAEDDDADIDYTLEELQKKTAVS